MGKLRTPARTCCLSTELLHNCGLSLFFVFFLVWGPRPVGLGLPPGSVLMGVTPERPTWRARDRTSVSHVQGKCLTHYTIFPVLELRFFKN